MNITIHGLTIHYEEKGRGPVLVLLHGWGGSLVSLQPLQLLLAEKGFRVISLDLPGFGASQSPGKDFSLENFAEVIELVLAKLKIKSCVLFGHSFGGSIAVKISARKKVYVGKLILCNTAGIRKYKSKKVKILKTVSHGARRIFQLPLLNVVYPFLRKVFYYYILRERDYIDQPQLSETFITIIDEDISDDLLRIDIPVLLLWGEKDKKTPVEHAKIMQKILKNVQVEIIKNVGHGLPLIQPKLVAEKVNTFLSD
jgi:pimeloyl-ACP methyl ester carboxylesterase